MCVTFLHSIQRVNCSRAFQVYCDILLVLVLNLLEKVKFFFYNQADFALQISTHVDRKKGFPKIFVQLNHRIYKMGSEYSVIKKGGHVDNNTLFT